MAIIAVVPVELEDVAVLLDAFTELEDATVLLDAATLLLDAFAELEDAIALLDIAILLLDALLLEDRKVTSYSVPNHFVVDPL